MVRYAVKNAQGKWVSGSSTGTFISKDTTKPYVGETVGQSISGGIVRASQESYGTMTGSGWVQTSNIANTSLAPTDTSSSGKSSSSSPVSAAYFTPSTSQPQSLAPSVNQVSSQPTQGVTKGFESQRPGMIEQPVYSSTYKNPTTGKTATVFERQGTAIEQKRGFFGNLWYQADVRLGDIGIGGILPGGASKEEARIVMQKEYLVASPKQVEQLSYRKKAVISSAIVTGAAATYYAVPALIKGGLTTLQVAGAKPVTTILGVGSIIGGGTAVYQGSKVIAPLSFSKEQRASYYSNKAIFSKAEKAQQLAISNVKFDITSPSVAKNFGIYTQTAKNVGSAAARESLKQSGYSGNIEEGVGMLQSKRAYSGLGYAGAIVSGEMGSELFVRTYASALPAVGKVGKRLVNNVAGLTAIGGMGEAASIDITSSQAGILKWNPIRTAAITFGGGSIASAIERKIVTTSLVSPGKSKVISGVAEAADFPGESIGDWSASAAQKSFNYVFRGGVKASVNTFNTKVVVPSFTGASSFIKGFGNAPSPIPSFKQGSVSVTKNVPKSNTKNVTPYYVSKLPTTTRIVMPTIPSGGGRVSGVTNFQNLNVIKTPTDIRPVIKPNSIVSIKPITDIMNPVKPQVPVIIRTNTNVEVPVVTDVPVSVIAYPFPFILPPGGGAGRGWGRNFFGGRVKGAYTPSLVATAFNIRGKQPEIMSGFNIRPILGTSKRKKGYAGGA